MSDCSSQVPTCLVITSNESVSSIETQFSAMCDDLKTNIQAITLMLDEKKCLTMKACIDHIQSKLRDALDVPHYDTEDQRLLKNDGDKSESGDDV